MIVIPRLNYLKWCKHGPEAAHTVKQPETVRSHQGQFAAQGYWDNVHSQRGVLGEDTQWGQGQRGLEPGLDMKTASSTGIWVQLRARFVEGQLASCNPFVDHRV